MLRRGFDQHEAGDLWVNGFLNRSCLFCCGVEDHRLALIHITQNSIQQDLEHMPSGANAILPFQLVNQRDLTTRKLERDGFRRGFLAGQTINLAAGRLSTLKVAEPLLLTA